MDSCKDNPRIYKNNLGFVTIVTKGVVCCCLAYWVVAIGCHIHSHTSHSRRIYWHTPCHNLLAYRVPIVGIFLGRGGYARMSSSSVAPQTQKKVISALFQVLDPPHVFITVLHKSTIRVKCLLCSPYFISRIGRAGWLSSLFF